MKKIILSLLLVVSTVATSFAIDIVPKFSIDLPSTFKTDYEVKVSCGLGVEGRYNISDYFDIGLGVDYLFMRTVSDKLSKNGIEGYYSNKDFQFVPVYATVIWYVLGKNEDYAPYVKVDGGYNACFYVENAKGSSGGLYIAGAVGFIIYENYVFELNTSRYEAKDNDTDITYKKISFKFGYKFTI